MNYRIAFYVTDKPRTHALAADVALGASRHGDTVNAVTQEALGIIDNYDGAAVLGMARLAKRVLTDYTRAGRHVLMFDKGYMDRGRYLRVSVNSWQPLAYFQRFMRPDDRLKKIMDSRQFVIRGRREPSASDFILLAGTCQSHNNFHDLGNINDYHNEVVRFVRKHTKRDIVYRPNPSWALKHPKEVHTISGTRWSSPETPFSSELQRAHLLITSGSSAAFEALAYGVPIMVLEQGIGAPMALGKKDYDKIDNPYWPTEPERYQFFADAAYCQWTSEEYRNGTAWEHIRLTLDCFGKDVNKASAFDMITQYRAMHQSPKVFRGLSTVKYFSSIGKLVLGTGAKTMLDYGSGKGEQYEKPHELQHGWDVDVTCYDPGVARLAKLPGSSFDGVICCDVLEHIPEPDVPHILKEMFGMANKFVFLAIAGAPANKTLPDGRNCHLTVRDEVWWTDQINRAKHKAGKDNLTVVATLEMPKGSDYYDSLPADPDDEEDCDNP